MKRIYLVLAGLFLVGLLLVGCSDNTPLETATETVPAATIETPVVSPTETTAQPVIILLAAPEANAADLAEAQSAVQQVASQNGLSVENRQMLSAETAPENLRMVVALPPLSGLEQLAAALPETRFVALEVPGISSTGNLISVAVEANPDFQAFLAGYISAVQANDWRFGLIYVGDESGRQYGNAFLNGAIYYCGLCTPYFLPNAGYPAYVEVAPGASLQALQQAVDSLVLLGVNTIHLAPGTQSDGIYQYAAAQNIRFVGTGAPPAGLEAYWIASVVAVGEYDLAAVISQALVGPVSTGAGSIEITFTGLSEARLSFFYEVLEQLENGMIDPQGGDIQ